MSSTTARNSSNAASATAAVARADAATARASVVRVDTEIQRMFRVAGIPLSPSLSSGISESTQITNMLDPSSHKQLRALILEKFQQQQEKKNKKEKEEAEEKQKVAAATATAPQKSEWQNNFDTDTCINDTRSAAVAASTSTSTSAVTTSSRSTNTSATTTSGVVASSSITSSSTATGADTMQKNRKDPPPQQASSSSSSSVSSSSVFLSSSSSSLSSSSLKTKMRAIINSKKPPPTTTPPTSTSTTTDTDVVVVSKQQMTKEEIKIEEDTDEIVEDLIRKEMDTTSMNQQFQEQKTMILQQTEIMVLLSNHIQELTQQVGELKESVQKLEINTSTSTDTKSTNNTLVAELYVGTKASTTTGVVVNGNGNTTTTTDGAVTNNNANNNNDGPIIGPVDMQRAHHLAHSVAWRVVTFPFRAFYLYTQFEYRCYLVMMRLVRRDIINPMRAGRENGQGAGGMIFQLLFALFIVYGRLAPALEKAFKEEQERTSGSSADSESADAEEEDDYDYATDYTIDIDDPSFQIYALTCAICVGFLYHVGLLKFFYNFFVRDKLLIRIAKDLRDGVELTPEYGLHFDDPPETTNNDINVNANANGAAAGVGGGVGGAAGGAGIPHRPNFRGINNGGAAGAAAGAVANNNNGGGAVVGAANRAIQGFNDFFMGHNRNGNAAGNAGNGNAGAGNVVGVAPVAAGVGADGADDNGNAQVAPPAPAPPLDVTGAVQLGQRLRQNLIIGLISDFICLLYSFMVSILPIWNPEQQLRDIREAQERRIRQQVEIEAEQLRRQNAGTTMALVVNNQAQTQNNNSTDNDNDDDDSESEDSTSDDDNENNE